MAVAVPIDPQTMGRLCARTRGDRSAAPVPFTADVGALHIAILAEPFEALDRRVFVLHYLWRVRHVKAAATLLGFGRPHWYHLLRAFRHRIDRTSEAILHGNATKLTLI